MNDELTPKRIREIETKWKSDVDLKLDALIARSAKYDAFLDMLLEREKNRAALTKALIEKGLGALVWAAVGGLCALVWAGMQAEYREVLEATRTLRK